MAGKVKSGGGARASPRHSEEDPKGLKAQEGIEWLAGLNHLQVTTDRCSDERPVGGAAGTGTGGATWREVKVANDKREQLGDEASWLGSEENP